MTNLEHGFLEIGRRLDTKSAMNGALTRRLRLRDKPQSFDVFPINGPLFGSRARAKESSRARACVRTRVRSSPCHRAHAPMRMRIWHGEPQLSSAHVLSLNHTGATPPPPRRKGRRGLRRACARLPSLSCVRAWARGETTSDAAAKRASEGGAAPKSAMYCKGMMSGGVPRRARVHCLTRAWRGVIEPGSRDRTRRVDQTRLAM